MANGSDKNSLPPPYAYCYRHGYYGHLYGGSMAGIILPQSLTARSTGNQSLPFFDPVDLPLTVSISDEEVQPLQLPEIVRAAQGSAKRPHLLLPCEDYYI